MRLSAPWYWYDFYSKHELQLLSTYVKGVESQIALGIAHYQENKKSEMVVLSEEEGIAEDVEHYAGLESMSWNLDDVFKGLFPNIQRKSAFLTLYAFLEFELDRLANRLRVESNLMVQPDDLVGQGIVRSLSYMQKVVTLDIDKNAIWAKVKGLNKLRNLIIHNDGSLVGYGGEKTSGTEVLKQLRPHIKFIDDRVKLERTFLEHTLRLFDKLFQTLDKAIALKYKSKRKKAIPFGKIRLKRKPALDSKKIGD